MQIRVLGPIAVIGTDGHALVIGSKRRRELLGRLVASGGRVVPLDVLIDDLWEDPPANAAGAVRTFVSELRRALGPDVITTVGRGYALKVEQVDAQWFEEAVRSRPAELSAALAGWGEPYADLDPSPWVLRERARLEELRSQAVELRARAVLDRGEGASLVAELVEFAGAHPWREKAQVLLAHALYQDGRQVEALTVLREARGRLVGRFGLDAVPDVDRVEADILRHALTRTGTYTRLRSVSTMAGAAALTGGANLALAQAQRAAAVLEAERLDNPELTARVLTAYDVPTNWTRSDDPAQSRALVETGRRTLRRLPGGLTALRARLLATIALEHRGTRDLWAAEAAGEAERLARSLGDPAVLVLALNARFVQSFQQPGRAGERLAIAGELIEVASRHDLPAYEILGHLVAMQAHGALGGDASLHVAAVVQLAEVHETPLVHVFVRAFRVMRVPDEAAYRALDLSGMPGVEAGFLPLALLSMRLPGLAVPRDLEWGPFLPWAQPLLHLADGDVAAARLAVAQVPTPRADHYYEILWALTAHTAILLGDRALGLRARDALEPARGEIIGGGTGMMSFGLVDDLLARLR